MSVVNNWAGAVTDTSFRVVANVTGSSTRLAVDTDPALGSPVFFGPVAPSAQGIADLTATGLDPDTQHYWAVEDDSVLDTSFQGKAHTHGTVGEPYSYTFAAFGCAGSNPDSPGSGDELAPDRVSNHPGFDDVRNAAPLFVAHMGDAHYYDLGSDLHGIVGGGSLANYRAAYDDVLDQPRQHQLYREVPVNYCWDDHDYGPNNSDGTHTGKDNAAQVYRERVPHYPLAEPSGAIYHSFQIGRVLHVVADARFHRDPNDASPGPGKTMLGSAQKTWLDNLLATSDAEALIWHMSAQWMGSKPDTWGSYRHERDELAAMFRDRGWAHRMCIISADLHALTIDTGAGNEWGYFPVYHFASIDSGFLGNPLTVFDQGGSGGRRRYGIVEVVDQGGAITITGTGYIGADVWKSHSFTIGRSVTYGLLSPPFEPVEDDQRIVNDVTASRLDGSSARVCKDTGALSIQEVGLYAQSVTVNVDMDDQLPDQAGWRVHLGTVDEPRYQRMTADLVEHPEFIVALAAVDSGDRLVVANPPDYVSDGDVALLVQGYEETLDAVEWTWTANTSPASPWTVGVVEDPVLSRADTDGSELATDISDVDTTLEVSVTAGPLWITDAEFPAEFPFDVEVGGEVMRVTAVSGTSSPQTFTVTRSVNGVVASHDDGEAVRLARPMVLGF